MNTPPLMSMHCHCCCWAMMMADMASGRQGGKIGIWVKNTCLKIRTEQSKLRSGGKFCKYQTEINTNNHCHHNHFHWSGTGKLHSRICQIHLLLWSWPSQCVSIQYPSIFLYPRSIRNLSNNHPGWKPLFLPSYQGKPFFAIVGWCGWNIWESTCLCVVGNGAWISTPG